MRLFVAIWPPQECVEELAAWWTGASVHLEGWGWRDVPKENWHLTLAFYGEVSGRALEPLAEALEACALAHPPLALTTAGMGVFPSPTRARVLWVGVEEANGGHGLARLAHCCRRALDATARVSGKRREKKQPFAAHITLARMRGEPLPMEMELLRDIPPPPRLQWQAEEICLMRSHLRPGEAPHYEVLESFPLMGVEP